MKYEFRKAVVTEIDPIWVLLKKGIEWRQKDGSKQWQDGYPNLSLVAKDIQDSFGFVLYIDQLLAAYCAIIKNDVSEYKDIDHRLLPNENYAVVHRLIVSEKYKNRGLATIMLDYVEEYILSEDIHIIKIDTYFDNQPMLHLLSQKGYMYIKEFFGENDCRKAFQKTLKKNI